MTFEKWGRYKLLEVGKIVTGKTPPTKDKENFGNDYPFITPVDMNGQKYIFKTERGLSQIGKSVLENYLLPDNAICVSCIGSDLGKVVKTSRKSFTNQQINSIICNSNFDDDFVFYALKFISPQIKNVGHHSTAVPIINKTDFSNFEITAPDDIKVQNRIAKLLSSLDDAIELNQQTNKTLEEIAQTIFMEMCLPKSNKLPKDWRALKLGKLIELKNGFAFKGIDFIENGIPVIKIKNVKAGKVILNNLSYVSREVADKAKRFRINKNDLLITMSGNRIDGTQSTWVGKVGIFPYDGEYLLNQRVSILNIIDNETISRYFLSQLLSAEELQYYFISNATSSGGQANISPELINNTEIIVPPKSILTIFNKIAENIYNMIFQNESENETLSIIRDLLLPKLMKGEINFN